MAEENPNYKIIFPDGYLAGPEIVQKEGALDNLFVRFEDGRRYRLVVEDFYMVAEEFVRYNTIFKLDWFAEPGLVVVSRITPEIIRDAVAALVEQSYFDNFMPLTNDRHKKGKLKEIPQFTVNMPQGYVAPSERDDFKYNGLVPNVVIDIEDGRSYRLQFEDFFSFTHRFASGARFGEVYFAEPSFVLVPRVTPEIIQRTISWLLEAEYFDRLKPLG